MPRFRLPRPAAPRGAGLLLAACCGLGIGFGCAGARAQQATPPSFDPFSTDTAMVAGASSGFQKTGRLNGVTDNGQPRTFQKMQPVKPPPSGAGITGFDATNAPAKSKTAPSSVYGARSYGRRSESATNAVGTGVGTSDAQTTADAQTTTQAISPYQQPIPPLASDARAEAPGQPPVPNLGPIRKPKKRKAHPDEPTDPYNPTGIHTGSFDIYPAIELRAGYDSNPGLVEDSSGSAIYTVEPEVKLKSNWSRHALDAELRGSYTGYSPDGSPTLSRPYVKGKVKGRLDASRDTKIELGGRLLVSTDNPGSPNLQVGLSKLPVYATFGGSAGVTRSFGRFDLTVKGDVERTVYQDSEFTDGSTASNKDRNYNQFSGTLRGSYELRPGIKPFVEVGADTRKHDLEPDAYGYLRNSSGVTAKAGTTFELTRVLTGEVSLGYTHRNYQDPSFGSVGGLIGDASLIWDADALNTFKLTASSTIDESSVAGVSGVFYRSVAMQYDHAYRRWLIGTLKLGFGVDTYEGGSTSSSTTTVSTICGCVITEPGQTTPDRQDLTYSAGFGLTYKFSRELWLKGQFQQKWVRSNVAGNDYDDSLFLLGVRLQR